VDGALQFAKDIEPQFATLVNSITGWLGDHAGEIMDKLWEWTQKGVDLGLKFVSDIQPKIAELAGKIMTWFGDHAGEIMNKLWEWTKKAVDIAAKFYTDIHPKLIELSNKMAETLSNEGPRIMRDLFNGLINGANGQNWGSVGKFVGEHIWNGLKNSPFGILLNANGTVQVGGVTIQPGSGAGQLLPGVGQNAKGTDNWRGGMSWVGEAGAEMLRLPGGLNMLTTGATLMNLPQGSQVIPLTGQYAGQNNIGTSGGSGTTITGNSITIQVIAAAGMDPAAIARAVRDELMKVGGGVQSNRNFGGRGIA
jgi:hypothetical protein